jgi:hypothetical protein
MPEIDERVRALYGDPPEDADARERALARLRAEMHLAEIPPTPLGRSRRRIALTAVAAVVVLITAFVIANRSITPARALDRLATVAAEAPPPTAEEFPAGEMEVLRFKTSEFLTPDGGTGGYTYFVRSHISTDVGQDGSVTRRESIEDVWFPTATDKAMWKEQGSRPIPQPGDVLTDHLTAADARWFDASAISTDPDELAAALEAGQVAEVAPGADQEFLLIGELLAHPGLDGAQRASLYHVAGSLDGVESLGSTTDPIGRSGEGFAVTTGNHRTVLIFDPTTAAPLASEQYTDGNLDEWFAYSAPKATQARLSGS